MLPRLFIKVDDEQLDLPEDAQINLSFNNPWIGKPTDIKASFSFPFTVPATPNNVKKLNHPYRINLKPGTSPTINNVTIGYDNTVLFTGVLLVTNASERAIEISFGVGSSNFYSKVSTLSLLDMFADEQITFTNTDEADFLDIMAQTVYLNADTSKIVCVPFFNWRFYNDEIVDNYAIQGFQNRLQKNVSGVYEFDDPNSVVSPFLYFKYLVERLMQILGFNVTYNFLTDDTEFKTLIVYNNYDANGYNLVDNIIPVKELLPDMLASDLITSTQNLLNVFFDFSLQTASVSIIDVEALIVSAEYTDWTDGAEAYPVVSYEKVNDGYTLEMAIDAADSLGSTFSQLDEFTEFTVLAPVNLLADLPTTDPLFTVRFVFNTKKYYIYSTPDPGTAASWTAFVYDKSKYIVGGGEFNIKSNISGFTMRKGGLLFEYDFSGFGTGIYVCTAELNGNSIYNGGNRRNFGMHLMFFRGEQMTEQGGNFVTCTCDTGKYFDFDPDVKYAIAWDHPTPYGDKGLRTTRYKNYLYWYFNERKVVKYRRYCNLVDLQNLSFIKKYRVNQTNYFIQQLNVTLGMNSISPAEITFVKA